MSEVDAGVSFGRYRLVRRLAIGGMAEAWIAKPLDGTGKEVVIKRVLPQFAADPEFLSRFQEEATLTLSLVHGNIVPVFEIGRAGTETYIVMEHLPGHDLRQVLRRSRETGKNAPPGVAAWMIAEVLRGLDYAHRKLDTAGRPLGLVHRDVSPSNIVVSAEGTVKLLDFGIAKAVGREATRTGVLRGKVGYMSPEQARGEAIGPSSDLFSAAVVLYELLAADKLFDGTSEIEILERVKSAEIPSVRVKNSAVPPELEKILTRALSRDASKRFATAAEFHSALGHFLWSGSAPGDAESTAAFVRDLFPEDALRGEGEGAGDVHDEPAGGTATHAPAGAARLGPGGPALILGGPGTPPSGFPPGSGSIGLSTNGGAAPAPVSRVVAGAIGGAAIAIVLGLPTILWLSHTPLPSFSPTPTGTPVAALAPESNGSLFVAANVDGASIWIDDVDTHQVTPDLVSGIRIGPRRLVVKHADFKDFEKNVDVSVQPKTERFVLAPAERGLLVEVEPAGATVTVEGHPPCVAPCTIDGLLPSQTVVVSAVKSGFHAASARVRVGDIHGPYRMTMTPIASVAASATATPVVFATPVARGSLTFAARPWAFLSIDQGTESDHPISGLPLDAGVHKIRIRNNALSVDLTCPFTIEPGKELRLPPVFLDKHPACPK